jgi:hypothetical protein
LVAIAACASTVVLPWLGGTASAGESGGQSGAESAGTPGLTPTPFLAPPPIEPGSPTSASNPDDITRLGELLYVTWQNGVGPDGTPTNPKAGPFSTIAAYRADTGKLVTTYKVDGRCDGLTADPMHKRVLGTVNEDSNSSLFAIDPAQPTLHHYSYSNPPTGPQQNDGGTDAISIAPDGTKYVAHSNPSGDTAAVYTLSLSGSTASLTPYFGVNDTAPVINPGPQGPRSAPLGLTDPDSNRFLPGDGGGTLVQVAQGDHKLVLATRGQRQKPQLRQLLLSNANGVGQPTLDDLVRVNGAGPLLVVDQKGNKVYSIDTGKLRPGTVIVSQPAGDTSKPALAVVNLSTGVVTDLNTSFVSPKGLLVMPADQGNSDQGQRQGQGQGDGNNADWGRGDGSQGSNG